MGYEFVAPVVAGLNGKTVATVLHTLSGVEVVFESMEERRSRAGFNYLAWRREKREPLEDVYVRLDEKELYFLIHCADGNERDELIGLLENSFADLGVGVHFEEE